MNVATAETFVGVCWVAVRAPVRPSHCLMDPLLVVVRMSRPSAEKLTPTDGCGLPPNSRCRKRPALGERSHRSPLLPVAATRSPAGAVVAAVTPRLTFREDTSEPVFKSSTLQRLFSRPFALPVSGTPAL